MREGSHLDGHQTTGYNLTKEHHQIGGFDRFVRGPKTFETCTLGDRSREAVMCLHEEGEFVAGADRPAQGISRGGINLLIKAAGEERM
ncbi:hypothetical protein H8B02_12930 [Bradyrhizobium sp. Pear77]|nr:hypothetical protein [Bradyrhizobium altum]